MNQCTIFLFFIICSIAPLHFGIKNCGLPDVYRLSEFCRGWRIDALGYCLWWIYRSLGPHSCRERTVGAIGRSRRHLSTSFDPPVAFMIYCRCCTDLFSSTFRLAIFSYCLDNFDNFDNFLMPEMRVTKKYLFYRAHVDYSCSSSIVRVSSRFSPFKLCR